MCWGAPGGAGRRAVRGPARSRHTVRAGGRATPRLAPACPSHARIVVAVGLHYYNTSALRRRYTAGKYGKYSLYSQSQYTDTPTTERSERSEGACCSLCQLRHETKKTDFCARSISRTGKSYVIKTIRSQLALQQALFCRYSGVWWGPLKKFTNAVRSDGNHDEPARREQEARCRTTSALCERRCVIDEGQSLRVPPRHADRAAAPLTCVCHLVISLVCVPPSI